MDKIANLDAALSPVPSHVPPDRVRHIDMYNLENVENGYHEAWKALQTPDIPDLVWTPFTGGHWIATRSKQIGEIYSDYSRFSSEIILLPKEAGEKYTVIPAQMDPPDHTPYRKLMEKGLTPRRVRQAEAKIREVAIELIDALVEKRSCDFSTSYAQILPVKVFMALADLPMEDVPLLMKLAAEITRPAGNTPEEMGQSLDTAYRGLSAYVESIVPQRLGGDGDDLVSMLVNGDVDGEPVPHDKSLNLVSLLLLGGLDTVVNFLSFLMLYLAKNPAKVAELRDNPNKIRTGLEEMLRRFPVLAESRKVVRDMEYCGVMLKAGDLILAPTALHGLDDALSDNPLDVDLDRKGVAHLTFGAGPHRCVGMNLARMEIIVTLEEWLKRIPEFRLQPSSTPLFQAGFMASVRDVQLEW